MGNCMPRQSIANGLHFLGFLRLTLALSVAGFHLSPQVFPDAGRQAVAGFFCISGFLVTKIARETYSDRPIEYLLNRLLRIFPLYWSCLLVVTLIVILLPAAALHPLLNLSIERDFPWWINQIMIFNLAPSAGKIIGQSWSLEVELYFYLYIGLATYRSLPLTIFSFIFFMSYALLAYWHLVSAPFYWVPLTTGFLFYGGSLAYFLYPKLKLGFRSCVSGIAVYTIAMYILPHIVRASSYDALIFLSSAGSILVLVSLPNIKTAARPISNVSAYCGRLTYPVFLLHVGCAVPVAAFVQNEPTLLLALSLPLTFAVSIILVHTVELPLENVRRKVRSRATGQQETSDPVPALVP
jgi:peptidoglycan/LPS O-acetylase OafA/YrhL